MTDHFFGSKPFDQKKHPFGSPALKLSTSLQRHDQSQTCGRMISSKVFGVPLQRGETRKKVTEGSARKYFEFLKNSKCQKERFAFCHTCLLRPVCGVAHCKILGFCTVPTFDDGHVVEPLHVWSSSTGASAH